MQWISDNLWIGGAVIVAAVMAQAVYLTFDLVRRSAAARVQRRREIELLEQRIAAARKRRAEEERKYLHWQGWRKFELIRKVREDQNDEQYTYYLRPHDGKPIPPYKPGQYITLRLQPPGEDKPVVRCYSLSDAAREDYYCVTIKRLGPPRDKPDAPPGKASSYLQDRAQEGDILDIQAPSGHFALDTSNEKPVVLIGSGIGMTPVFAMLRAITESGGSRETWFFYGVRNSREQVFREQLEQIAREHENVRLCICYSRPIEGEDVEGRDYHVEGRVTAELLKEKLPSNNYDFYLCGPPAMMQTLPDEIAEWGVPESRIHLETFGPSSRKKKKPAMVPAGAAGADGGQATGPQIKFRKTGVTANWDAAKESLWDVAEESGVHIDAGCFEGNCGTCLTTIVSGEVEYDKDPGFDCEEGTCLACCCRPKGPVELDA